MKKITNETDARKVWKLWGSFGELFGNVLVENNCVSAENDAIKAYSEYEKDENGVFSHTGYVKNISDESVTLNSLMRKFHFDGGEYEVYTQYNVWQNESTGSWQPLITGVSAETKSNRNTFGAAPFLVLWNKQTGRGCAFHLLADTMWRINAERVCTGGQNTELEVSLGISDYGFSYELMPGDILKMPEVICYRVMNKTDMDCWKLHNYMNKKYPRREMPVIYNTWLYKFDKFTYDDILGQIDAAAKIGAEYFVIDAGWFGKGEEWGISRGDWIENTEIGFKGRMVEIADEVRRAGMKFGFWIECETASPKSDIIKKYPDYYIEYDGTYFVDFSNPDACRHILDIMCGLIDKYGAKFIKFDYNNDIKFDKYFSGFSKYFEGYQKVMTELQKRYPDLYMENCASGGQRMALRDGKYFQSFWSTDDQGIYNSMRIYKDTVLRLPPQWIERWITISSLTDKIFEYPGQPADIIISTKNATWGDVVGVSQDYINAYILGGPVGMSFDLNSLSAEAFDSLKSFIAKIKAEREFLKNAVCRILTNTETMTVFEYSDTDFSKIKLVVVSDKVVQNNIKVFPKVDPSVVYSLNDGREISGNELFEDGINVEIKADYRGEIITLERK